MTRVPSRAEYFSRWSALHGGYDPTSSRIVGFWLGLVYVLARPLAALRISPNAITVAGGAVTLLAAALCWWGGGWVVVASTLILVSGLLDNLDGAVAVLTDRSTDFGYVLDSTVDRLADAAFVAALYLVGAPLWLAALGGVLAGLQEYARARAGAAGMTEVGVVTPSERPTRVLVTGLFLLGAGLYPSAASTWATAGAAVYAIGSLVGLAMVLHVVRRRLV